MAATTSAPSVLLRLALPDAILSKYQNEATEFGVELEELIANRLSECVSYNSTKPLYFTDTQRRSVESLLGRNVNSPGEVLEIIRRFLTVKVNGISMTIRPEVLERLRTRHFDTSREFGVWLSDCINEWAEAACGMR